MPLHKTKTNLVVRKNWNIEIGENHATYHRLNNEFVDELGVKLGQNPH